MYYKQELPKVYPTLANRLSGSLLLTAGLFILGGCNGNKNNEKAVDTGKKPNIIYILADDLGYADIGPFGQKLIKTPNLDRMASRGMVFNNHFAGTSVCAPSRSVLMTGLHSGHTYVRGNKQAEPYGQVPLKDSIINVAELLKESGYATGIIGKWGLGVENTEGDPRNQGFDYFYGYYCQVHAHNSFPEYLYENGQKVFLRNKVNYMPDDHWSRGLGGYATEKIDYSNDLFQEKALSFIEKNRDTSFFLYLAVVVPHNNGEAPDTLKHETPSLFPYENETWTYQEKCYAASVTRLDSLVGRVLAKLDTLGIAENTLVVFTSDNGPEKEDVFDSNAGMRGGKRDLFEGGIKVPFIALWPGTIAQGSVSAHLSAFWDFLPTVCDISGIPVPEWTDGISYLPTLQGKSQPEHPYFYWEFHEQGGKQAVRMGKWKAVRLNVNSLPDGPVMLFDLEKDPLEAQDIGQMHPDTLLQLTEIMNKERTPSELFPFGKEK